MGQRPRKNYKKVTEESVKILTEEVEVDPYRRQKKLLNHNFRLADVKALTINQRKAFLSFGSGQNILMYGVAGTGKTFLGMYFGLSELFVGNCRQVIIIRSAVASRDLGFLPGTLSEKMTVYEAPYKDLCSELCGGRRDVYDALKKKGNLDFMSTSFIRGLTFDEAIVIVDEVQNLTDHELNSVLTRIGKNCRVLLCGDFRQDDLKMTGKKSHETGIHNMIRIAQVMPSFDLVEFQIDDIVRSGFVKEYIVARLKLKMD